MQFESLASFLDMGGYGFYVWLSFGASFALLAILIMASKQSNKVVKKQIIQQIKRQQKLKLAAEKQHAELSESSAPQENEVKSES